MKKQPILGAMIAFWDNMNTELLVRILIAKQRKEYTK
jgi:hypothetical protein